MDALKILKNIHQMTVLDVWPSRPITWVSSTCNLLQCLELFKEKKVLSFPVVESSNRCIGVVDVMDVIIFLVASFPNLEAITMDVLTNLEFQGRKFLEETIVSQVTAYAKAWNYEDLPKFPLRVDTPLIELIQAFSVGAHRVPVVNDELAIINFVSQMDLLRFLSENIYLLEERGMKHKTIGELGIGRNTVHFARSDAMVILCLASMATYKVSAMPILDKETGKLVATFSASDLRGIGPGDLSQLLRPLSSFLATFNVKSLYPLTCRYTDTLEHVILKLAGCKVHRLWVVDDSQKLLGVVSLTEVMFPFLGIEPMQLTPFTPEETPRKIYVA